MKHFSNNDFKLDHFTSLSKKDQELVLSWRNHKSVRNAMISKTPITKVDHFTFIKTLETDQTKQYWLVKKKNLKVGVVYLIALDTKQPELGMYIAPKTQGKGYGSWVLEHFLEFILSNLKISVIRLEVFKDNIPAIGLYTKFGFRKIATKDSLIVMERHEI